MDAQSQGNWADRLGTTKRTILLVVTAILGVFVIGTIVVFGVAVTEDGQLPIKPLPYVIFAVFLALAAAVGWLMATLIRSFRRQEMSGFDRRYWRMWGIVVILGMPIGMGLAIFGFGNGGSADLSLALTNSPISPLAAILLSAGATALLVASAVIYHRTIDDHEERAYLWGSTIGYYFLVLVFPLHWLLARGGILPALTIGFALLLVLLSCIVQAIVWALFKFR